VKIIIDVNFDDGYHVLMAPVGDLAPDQIREIQRVFETRRIILLPPVMEDKAWERNWRSA
jgi:hypothetical protein